VNFVVAILATPIAAWLRREGPPDRTQALDYQDAATGG